MSESLSIHLAFLSFASLCARVLKFRNQGGEAHGKFTVSVYVQADTCDIYDLLFH